MPAPAVISIPSASRIQLAARSRAFASNLSITILTFPDCAVTAVGKCPANEANLPRLNNSVASNETPFANPTSEVPHYPLIENIYFQSVQ